MAVSIDSSSLRLSVKHLKIVDSTTIGLFSDIPKGVGRNPVNGKRKGGIKMHTVTNVMEDVPCLVRFQGTDRTLQRAMDNEESLLYG